ncbi:hypothetical protein RUND412_009508 [Rhizina undulata]
MNDHFEPPLASLSLTHVYYNPDDPLSLLCAWLALVPQALMVSYVTLIWAQRELELLLVFAGQLFCEAINWVLKRTFKEARPKQMHGNGYGMPSSHAQFVAYFAMYLSLWVTLRSKHLLIPYRLLIVTASFAGSVAVSLSRLYLAYHTTLQVTYGYIAGAIFAIAWFAFTQWLRNTDLGKDSPLAGLTGGRRLWDWGLWWGEMFWIRDMCTEVDLIEWEWSVWKVGGWKGKFNVPDAVKALGEMNKKNR